MHYTKPDIDFMVGELSSNHYTKEESDSSFSLKANQATTYTKPEVDSNLALKAPLHNPTFSGTVGGLSKKWLI